MTKLSGEELQLGFAVGGLTTSFYPLSLAETNDYLKRGEFIAASAGLNLIYSLGAGGGPLIASWAMAGLGPGGLFVFIAAALSLSVGFSISQLRRPPAKPAEHQGGFVPASHLPATAAHLDPRASIAETSHAAMAPTGTDNGASESG